MRAYLNASNKKRLDPAPKCCLNCQWCAWREDGPQCWHWANRSSDVDVQDNDGKPMLVVMWDDPEEVEWDTVCDLHSHGDPVPNEPSRLTPGQEAVREVWDTQVRMEYIEKNGPPK